MHILSLMISYLVYRYRNRQTTTISILHGPFGRVIINFLATCYYLFEHLSTKVICTDAWPQVSTRWCIFSLPAGNPLKPNIMHLVTSGLVCQFSSRTNLEPLTLYDSHTPPALTLTHTPSTTPGTGCKVVRECSFKMAGGWLYMTTH